MPWPHQVSPSLAQLRSACLEDLVDFAASPLKVEGFLTTPPPNKTKLINYLFIYKMIIKTYSYEIT